jgi:hypothetical protein
MRVDDPAVLNLAEREVRQLVGAMKTISNVVCRVEVWLARARHQPPRKVASGEFTINGSKTNSKKV